MFVLPDMKPDEIIMYLRKSRADDPSLTVSETVAKHEQILDDFSMRTFGALIPENNRYREIVSGETISARPEIKKVLRLIEQPQYKAILIVEPQRLSRGDLEDIGYLSKILRFTHTIVITKQYSYDLTDDRDREYFENELKRGNDYLEYSKRIMRNGRNLSAEKGYYLASRRPFGYKKVYQKDGHRKYPTLEIIPDEADIVRLIFRLYADGCGATKICSRLNAMGCKPLQNGIWTPPCIYPILDNPVYIGKIKWGQRKTIQQVVDGEIVKSNPRQKDYALYDGKHEPILDETLWNAVRARRDTKEIPRVIVSKDLQNPLSGVLYCKCGRMMIRRPFGGRCVDRYQCPNQTICNNASCTVPEMIESVTGILTDAITDFEIKIESGQIAGNDDYLQALYARRAEIERKEESLWEKYTDEDMPRNIFDKLLAKNEQAKQDVSALIEAAEKEPKPIDYQERVVTFLETLNALQGDSPAAETNELLKSCIRRITYSRERGERISGTKQKGGWVVNPMQLQVELNI